jgi:hypothetical protein
MPERFSSVLGGDMLMVSGKARLFLAHPLAEWGEFLPLACDEGEFSAFNVTRLEDVPDEAWII